MEINLNPEIEIILTAGEEYVPVRSSDMAGGYDLRLVVPEVRAVLEPGKSRKFSAGFKLNINNPHIAFLIIPRSGSGSKGKHLANVIGLIDADYQGEVSIIVKNNSTEELVVTDKERYAQGYFDVIAHPQFKFVTEFEKATVRGSGGFGSTGIN